MSFLENIKKKLSKKEGEKTILNLKVLGILTACILLIVVLYALFSPEKSNKKHVRYSSTPLMDTYDRHHKVQSSKKYPQVHKKSAWVILIA